LDNDRFGHGRGDMVLSRIGPDGRREVNPRTLWSTTVARTAC
jgi:hypothetical protein